VNSRRTPAVRAPKANEHERAQRQAAVEILLRRALHGVLSVPEAAVLADYWRAERELADKTRRSLGETTRALQRNREAADAEIQRLEAHVEELLAAASVTPGEALDGRQAGQEPAKAAADVRGAVRPAGGHSADPADVTEAQNAVRAPRRHPDAQLPTQALKARQTTNATAK